MTSCSEPQGSFSDQPTLMEGLHIKWTKPGVPTPEQFELRRIVFHEEQGFPHDKVCDELDVLCHQCLITDSNHKLVGCSRICPHSEEDAWVLDRIAVMEEFRGKGIGRYVVRVAMNYAQLLGAKRFVLVNAEVSVIPFYQKLGFKIDGEPFMEEHCPVIKMTRAA
ncbi:putative GNAT family N-acetyltransferase [Blattamonas nauphoetae]|uniref:GNAT family N-acetyltransferase n=1 Tax=Blattamonas nauphoetae TaxID=2049346 RepID=A0ABQ9WR70_9EUKA|nr:putative GNAT family N-acetyltransferase [Blattamonas nauphoetae]